MWLNVPQRFFCGNSALKFLHNFQYRRYLIQERMDSRGLTWFVPVWVKDRHAPHPEKGAPYAYATPAHWPCRHPVLFSVRIRGLGKTDASCSTAAFSGNSERRKAASFTAFECHGQTAYAERSGKTSSSGAILPEGINPSPGERCPGAFRSACPGNPRRPSSASDFSSRRFPP